MQISITSLLIIDSQIARGLIFFTLVLCFSFYTSYTKSLKPVQPEIMTSRCIVQDGEQLADLPDEEKWTEDLQRVSLMHNNMREIRSRASPRRSVLSTILPSRNDKLRRTSVSFFSDMVRLRVLDLSNTSIENLPNNISDLENLTALVLRECRHLKYVPSLAKLRALRTLDLNRTEIEEVPQGMEMLVNLKHLDLNARCLKMLPIGILPNLSHLRCLIVWCGKENLIVKAEEVAGLRKLQVFAGRFSDSHDLSIYVKSWQGSGPRRYLLDVGPYNSFSFDVDFLIDEEIRDFEIGVVLIECSISGGGEDPLVLPIDAKSLIIEKCHDVVSLDALFKREGTSPSPPGTFSCLKRIIIRDCGNIKKLFTVGLLPHFQNLTILIVENCKGMEEIIAANSEGEGEQVMGESIDHSTVNNDDSVITITLPKLRFLDLSRLPELKSIVYGGAIMVCDSLEEIYVSSPKLKRLPLYLPVLNGKPSPPPALRHIGVHTELWELLEWDHPHAKVILQPFTRW